MNFRSWISMNLGVALLVGAAIAAAQSGTVTPDSQGLIKVRSSVFDGVSVRPDVDFRRYTRIMIDPTQVALADNWLRNMNTPPLAIMRRTTAQDAEQIVNQARNGFASNFAATINRAGFEIVSTPGPDVLRLSPNITNLSVAAPASLTNAPLTRVYTFNAGDATLGLEVRDSVSGELLARVVDHRIAGQRSATRSNARITSTATNRFDFGNMFDAWSTGWVQTFDELKQQSPGKGTASAPLH
jgi:hypothetical protein